MKNKYFLLLLIVSLSFCKVKESGGDAPKQSANPVIIEKSLPAKLTPATVKEFILWASGSTLEEREKVREQINLASSDNEVLNLLFKELEKVDLNDVGYSLIVLSIIGELKNPESLDRLTDLAFRKLPQVDSVGEGGLNKRAYVEMFSSKAVECLAYLQNKKSNEVTLKVITEHPSKAVRSAAIDAYLFNNGDTQEAKEFLRSIVKAEEKKLIDRARFKLSKDANSFNSQLSRFYELHPEEVALKPDAPTEKIEVVDSTKFQNPISPPKRNQK